MNEYEVEIITSERVVVEAESKEEAENIVDKLIDENSPEIEYIGYEFKTIRI